MQFRKVNLMIHSLLIESKSFNLSLIYAQFSFQVCNHPELFERRDAKSPYFMRPELLELPSLLFKEDIMSSTNPSKEHLLYNKFFIFATEYIHRELFDGSEGSCFSFSRFSNLTPMELNSIFVTGVLFR